MIRFFIPLLLAATAGAQTATDLWLRGRAVIPTPRTVRLEPGDVRVDEGWGLVLHGNPGMAAQWLVNDLRDLHGVTLRGNRSIRLAVQAGAIQTKAEPGIDKQAYRLRVADDAIEITGNAEPGLFYGVQTFLQLLKRDAAGRLMAPRCTIEDWPRLQLRFLHWDTKHHQDRMETLKRYLDWAARFKANMIGFELEDKFAYPSHPQIGAPGAFTPAELQEIVNYGLARYIQVVPVIQAPAHLSYVLKHPEFAGLRADGNNYQSAMCDPRTYDLIFSMYDDAIKATKGVDYLFASTDEVYYAGIESKCARPYNPVNRSLQWAEFVQKAHEHIAKQGRRMLIWAEYPLLPQHVSMIPPDVIDGVIGEQAYVPIEKKMGMRQLAYVSMQGEELLFPSSLAYRNASGAVVPGRVEEAYESIRHGRHWQVNPIGAFGAAWDDSGLHNETFWLGWSAVAHYAWNPEGAPPDQHVAEFMKVYYGDGAAGMIGIYEEMERQARAFEAAWDRVVSKVRGPGYGNSYGKGVGTTRYDRTLSAPALPALPDLEVKPLAAEKYAKLLGENPGRELENEHLVLDLQSAIGRVERNQYNLEVYLALARFMGHHWRLLAGLSNAERSLTAAAESARRNDAARAVGHLVAAHNLIERLRREGEAAFATVKTTYEKSRWPNGREVNGRKFLWALDDTKDHFAGRTPDLGFMAAPERSMGLDRWLKDLARIIEAYAKQHNVPVRGLAEERLEAD